jgi:ribosome-associated protein
MAKILRITSRVAIPERELRYRFSRSSGPGGQHVNKASTRVELIFNLNETVALREGEKSRLRRTLRRWLDSDDAIRIVEESSRSQWVNRKRATSRFVELLRDGLKPRKRRVMTKPSRQSREERLKRKKRRGELKRRRGSPREPE